jgi:hypothetical protein
LTTKDGSLLIEKRKFSGGQLVVDDDGGGDRIDLKMKGCPQTEDQSLIIRDIRIPCNSRKNE